MKFYCVKCRKTVNAEPTSSTKVKGRSVMMHKSKCSKCGTKLNTFGKL